MWKFKTSHDKEIIHIKGPKNFLDLFYVLNNKFLCFSLQLNLLSQKKLKKGIPDGKSLGN